MSHTVIEHVKVDDGVSWRLSSTKRRWRYLSHTVIDEFRRHPRRHCAAALAPAHRRPYFRDTLVLPSPTSLHATSTTSTIKPLREKQLVLAVYVAVALSARWLRALDSVNTFVFPLTPPPGPPTASLAPHTTCAPAPLCHPSRLAHREISPP